MKNRGNPSSSLKNDLVKLEKCTPSPSHFTTIGWNIVRLTIHIDSPHSSEWDHPGLDNAILIEGRVKTKF